MSSTPGRAFGVTLGASRTLRRSLAGSAWIGNFLAIGGDDVDDAEKVGVVDGRGDPEFQLGPVISVSSSKGGVTNVTAVFSASALKRAAACSFACMAVSDPAEASR